MKHELTDDRLVGVAHGINHNSVRSKTPLTNKGDSDLLGVDGLAGRRPFRYAIERPFLPIVRMRNEDECCRK
jgi:hypothetical protein